MIQRIADHARSARRVTLEPPCRVVYRQKKTAPQELTRERPAFRQPQILAKLVLGGTIKAYSGALPSEADKGRSSRGFDVTTFASTHH
eukprot:7144400-Prymnesium_polylepis.1